MTITSFYEKTSKLGICKANLVHLNEFFVSSVEFCKFEFNDTRDNETGTQGPTGPTGSVGLPGPFHILLDPILQIMIQYQ